MLERLNHAARFELRVLEYLRDVAHLAVRVAGDVRQQVEGGMVYGLSAALHGFYLRTRAFERRPAEKAIYRKDLRRIARAAARQQV